jgi:hypothetical protein
MTAKLIRDLFSTAIAIASLSLFASCPAWAQGCAIDYENLRLFCGGTIAPSNTIERSLKLQNDALSLQNSTTVDLSGERTCHRPSYGHLYPSYRWPLPG